MDRVPSDLAQTEVKDAAGNPHQLGEAWATQPAALVWVRHFG
jgi:hypothetical protein